MKRYTFLILIISIFLLSCEEKDIALFDGDNQIYFEKFYIDEFAPGYNKADSTEYSFFFYPTDTKSVDAELIVCLSGRLLEEDTEFQIKVVEDETTAEEGEYEIADKYIFNANNISETDDFVKDTIAVKLIKTARIEGLEESARLVVELIPNSKLGVGQLERRKAIIRFSAKACQPAWWDYEVRSKLLGDYSQKKYKLFLDHADPNSKMNGDLIKNYPSEAIELAMKFKKWLNEQNPKILDEDGSVMDVKL